MLLKKTFIAIMICMLYKSVSAADTLVEPNEILLGIKGGRSTVIGYYEDLFKNPLYIGLYGIYPLSIISRMLYIESELEYTHYPLEKSSSSDVTVTSFGIGLLFHYPLFRYLQPFAAIDTNLNYLKLSANNTGNIERTYKMGAKVKTGVFIPVGSQIRVQCGAEYLVTELSHENFERINYTAGISYNVTLYEKARTRKVRQRLEANRFFEQGKQYMADGKIEEAIRYYNKALSIDPSLEEAKNDIKRINQAKVELNHALSHVQKGDIFEAIPLLESSAKVLPEAQNNLLKIRSELSTMIKQLEQKGIAAYEQKEYKKCIKIMKQLKLIDPENKLVEIYLPRAQKRYEALQRLE